MVGRRLDGSNGRRIRTQLPRSGGVGSGPPGPACSAGLVTGWPARQDDRRGLQERVQSLDASFAPDAGLLEPAEGDAEIGAERVVAHRAGAELPGHGPGAIDVVGEALRP